MDNFKPDFELLLETLIKFILVIVTTTIMSIERERHSHPGGVVTHILAGLGACLFTIISMQQSGDPARIAANIVSGIGFLGSATIFKSNKFVKGINTAANLWVSAGLGMAIGFGLWELSLLLSIIVSGILFASNKYYKDKRKKIRQRDKQFKEEIIQKQKTMINQPKSVQQVIKSEIDIAIQENNDNKEDFDYIGDVDAVDGGGDDGGD